MRTISLGTLWTDEGRECMLFRVDGRYELHLRSQGRAIRVETCASEAEARRKAAKWLTDSQLEQT